MVTIIARRVGLECPSRPELRGCDAPHAIDGLDAGRFLIVMSTISRQGQTGRGRAPQARRSRRRTRGAREAAGRIVAEQQEELVRLGRFADGVAIGVGRLAVAGDVARARLRATGPNPAARDCSKVRACTTPCRSRSRSWKPRRTRTARRPAKKRRRRAATTDRGARAPSRRHFDRSLGRRIEWTSSEDDDTPAPSP